MKTEHIKAGADATVFVHIYLIYIETIHVLLLHLICSSRDRLGFYAEIQIIFETLYTNLFLRNSS